MPAVRSVLVIGAGAAGDRDGHPPRRAGCLRRPRRRQARCRRPRLRHHPARATRCGVFRAARASGTRSPSRATPSTALVSAPPTRTAPSSPSSPTPAPAARTCPQPSACTAPSWPASSSTAPSRPEPRSASAPPPTTLVQDEDGVDVDFADGSTRTLRPRRRRGRHPLLDPRRPRHRPRDPQHRHGHLARLRAAARQRHPHRPGLRRPLLHRRLLPDRRGHHVRLPRREGPGPHRPLARGVARGHARSSPRPTTAPGTRSASADRPLHRQLHLVRGATSCPRRGTAAGSSSSATPRTPARPPSPRAPPKPWRTPRSSPSSCWPHDALERRDVAGVRGPPLRPREEVVEASAAARPVAARRRTRATCPASWAAWRSSLTDTRLTSPLDDLHDNGASVTDERLITHLRHVDLAVPDYDKQLEFYTDMWGLSRRPPTTASPSSPPKAPRSSTRSGSARTPRSGST